jgi:hypothetical protein
MRRWFLLALFVSGAAAASAAPAPEAGAAPLAVGDYIQRLESIDALLATNALAPAKVEASALIGTEVTWARGKFLADTSVLQAILDAGSAEGPHRARLMAAIVELRRASGMESARGDRRLLERIAAEQDVPELPEGGAIPTKLDRDVPMFERIARAIGEMLHWVSEQLRKFLEWLLDLLLQRRAKENGSSATMRWIVYAVVALIVLVVLWLAIGVLRRSRASTTTVSIETGTLLGSKADEDPLSRGATEWERYAAELAKAGRFREAIRAWYHAVLVTSYAAGILHFRKGRTNWEYLALLAPSLPWRADMIELTRRFEREWYGSLHSTQEALDDCSEFAERIIDMLRRDMRGAA